MFLFISVFSQPIFPTPHAVCQFSSSLLFPHSPFCSVCLASVNVCLELFMPSCCGHSTNPCLNMFPRVPHTPNHTSRRRDATRRNDGANRVDTLRLVGYTQSGNLLEISHFFLTHQYWMKELRSLRLHTRQKVSITLNTVLIGG